jgi:hypothetical protein
MMVTAKNKKRDAAPGGEVLASIVWISSKRDAQGRITKGIVYEPHDEPDLLRELELPEEQLYPGATRGDAVLVQPSAPSIRKTTA